MMRFFRLGWLSGMLVAALLSACSSTPVTHYYVLDAIKADSRTSTPVAATAVVLEVDIPSYLDRPRMVSRDEHHQLRLAEYHQWGGRLRENIAHVLADNLLMRLASAEIYTVPIPDDVEPDATLTINIRTFERMADAHVHLSAQWHLTTKAGHTQYHFAELTGTQVIGAQDYAAMTSEMDTLLAQFAAHIADSFRHTQKTLG